MTRHAGLPSAESPSAEIPRLLHHVWLGPRPVPARWAGSWARRHPRWEHRIWRAADIEPILPDGLRRAWAYYVERSIWHGAADVGRIAILRLHGGVYVDIDSEPVRSFEKAPFMRGTFFVGLERGTPERPEHITNGVIGAVPGHPILAEVVDRISRADDLRSPWRTVGGGPLTQAVLAHREMPGVYVLPVRTFYPEDKDGRPAPGRARIYTRQYWATTHGLYDHADEGWRTLAKRRRGEPIPPPIGSRLREAVRHATRPGGRLRRWFRLGVPKPIRRVARAALRLARREGDGPRA